jgi:hypothetical protein
MIRTDRRTYSPIRQSDGGADKHVVDEEGREWDIEHEARRRPGVRQVPILLSPVRLRSGKRRHDQGVRLKSPATTQDLSVRTHKL